YDEMYRFERDEDRIQGHLQDLMELLPPSMNGKMGVERSTAAHRVWKEAGPDIFGCSKMDLSSSSKRKHRFQERVGWCCDSTSKKGGYYDQWLSEVLYDDYDGTQNKKKIFLNLTFAAVVFGKESVCELKEAIEEGDLNPVAHGRGEVLSDKWGLTHTTPGAIACSAARFALSPDDHFKAKSGSFNWEEDFNNYLKFLKSGLLQQRSFVLNIFCTWDSIFFPDTNNSLGGPLQNEHHTLADESSKAAMQMVDEQSTEEEE
ncbi:hypothetical protein BT96DRAFT_754528, partial [Gymnopus androsaceus JB14]